MPIGRAAGSLLAGLRDDSLVAVIADELKALGAAAPFSNGVECFAGCLWVGTAAGSTAIGQDVPSDHTEADRYNSHSIKLDDSQ